MILMMPGLRQSTHRPTGSASVSIRQYKMSSTASHSGEKIYLTLEELQKDLDTWMEKYNTQRTYQGKRCLGRTPIDTFMDNMPQAKRKLVGYMMDA
jgi:hypothetical protein